MVTASTVEESVTAPTVEESVTASTVEESVTASTVEESVTAPTVEESVTAPTVEESVTASTVEESVTAPTVEESVTAPTVEKSVTASTVEESVTAPTVEESVTASTVEESVTFTSEDLAAPASAPATMPAAEEAPARSTTRFSLPHDFGTKQVAVRISEPQEDASGNVIGYKTLDGKEIDKQSSPIKTLFGYRPSKSKEQEKSNLSKRAMGMLEKDRVGSGAIVRMEFANMSVYEGEWVNGKREGDGRQVFADGDWYEGKWYADLPDGKGRLTWKRRVRVFRGHVQRREAGWIRKTRRNVGRGNRRDVARRRARDCRIAAETSTIFTRQDTKSITRHINTLDLFELTISAHLRQSAHHVRTREQNASQIIL